METLNFKLYGKQIGSNSGVWVWGCPKVFCGDSMSVGVVDGRHLSISSVFLLCYEIFDFIDFCSSGELFLHVLRFSKDCVRQLVSSSFGDQIQTVLSITKLCFVSHCTSFLMAAAPTTSDDFWS